jgi:hypothetical protein
MEVAEVLDTMIECVEEFVAERDEEMVDTETKRLRNRVNLATALAAQLLDAEGQRLSLALVDIVKERVDERQMLLLARQRSAVELASDRDVEEIQIEAKVHNLVVRHGVLIDAIYRDPAVGGLSATRKLQLKQTATLNAIAAAEQVVSAALELSSTHDLAALSKEALSKFTTELVQRLSSPKTTPVSTRDPLKEESVVLEAEKLLSARAATLTTQLQSAYDRFAAARTLREDLTLAVQPDELLIKAREVRNKVDAERQEKQGQLDIAAQQSDARLQSSARTFARNEREEKVRGRAAVAGDVAALPCC